MGTSQGCAVSLCLWMKTLGSINPRMSVVLQEERGLNVLCPDSETVVLVQWQRHTASA